MSYLLLKSFLSLSVLLEFLALLSSKKCSCRQSIFENIDNVDIKFWTEMPSPVLLKLVMQIFFCRAATVTQIGVPLAHYPLARNIYWEQGTGGALLAAPQPAGLVAGLLEHDG